MANTFGRNKRVAIGQESSYNSYVSPAAHGLYILDADFEPNRDILQDMASHGRPEKKLSDIAEGIKNWTGKVTGKLPKEDFNWLLLNALGAITTTQVGSSSYYKHIHKVSVGTPKSLSVLYQQDVASVANREWRLSGGTVKLLKLLFKLNQPIRFEIDLLGGTYLLSQTVGSAPTYNVPASGDPFLYFKDGVFTINALTTWNDIEINIENTCADDPESSYVLGSQARARLERAGEPGIRLHGKATRILDEETDLTAWDQLTTITLDFLYGTIDSEAYAFNINLDKVKILDHKRTSKGMGLFEEVLTFESFYDSADTDNTIIVQDTQSTPATQ